MRKKSTLAQVALRAGVSKTTASYVINRTREMSKETTERVLTAARDLGYRVDTRASGLRRGDTDVVGVVTVGSSMDMVMMHNSLFWSRFTDAFVHHCSELDMVVSFASENKAQILIDSGVDILVVLGLHTEGHLEEFRIPFGMPTLSVAPIVGHEMTLLRHNPDAIGQAVMDHAAEQGARKLGLLMLAPMTDLLGDWGPAMTRFGSQKDVDVVVRAVGGAAEDWRIAVDEVIAMGCDAIFALSPHTRMVRDAIDASGRRVPKDLILMVQAEGLVEDAMDPQVTHLSLEATRCAEVTAQTAHKLVVGKSPPQALDEYPFSFNVRASSLRVPDEQGGQPL